MTTLAKYNHVTLSVSSQPSLPRHWGVGVGGLQEQPHMSWEGVPSTVTRGDHTKWKVVCPGTQHQGNLH